MAQHSDARRHRALHDDRTPKLSLERLVFSRAHAPGIVCMPPSSPERVQQDGSGSPQKEVARRHHERDQDADKDAEGWLA
eukprot:4028683-Prymnesium_polylepis.1